jgi:cytochrome c oxidase subunit 2
VKKLLIMATLTLVWLCSTSQSFQSSLDPGGRQAGIIENIWWIFLVVLGLVFLIVLVFLAKSLWNARKKEIDTTQYPVPVADGYEEAESSDELRVKQNVSIGMGITAAILVTLTIVSYTAERSLLTHKIKDLLIIEVRGNQWWWDFRYVDSTASRRVKTANELHIPVGRPVMIRGTSNDVIHSFWLPNLNGKKDLIPGHTSEMIISADKPGRFRGQCAEFCGHQHAHMAFWVIADLPDDYNAWAEHQLQPAQNPQDVIAQRGKEVFLAASCIMCHAISGTGAGGSVAPDLTHFASRSTIAAGTMSRTDANLALWIKDPQNVKPGTKMPPNNLRPDDMRALVAYLQSLK